MKLNDKDQKAPNKLTPGYPPSQKQDKDVRADQVIEPLELDVDDSHEAKVDNVTQAKVKK